MSAGFATVILFLLPLCLLLRQDDTLSVLSCNAHVRVGTCSLTLKSLVVVMVCGFVTLATLSLDCK